MTQTIEQIQQGMLDRIAADAELKEQIYSTSKTALYRMYTYIVAVAHWMLQVLFDEHKSEVEAKIANERKGSLQWHTDMAKAFQYGHALVGDTDTYAVVDEDARIIKHAKVDEIGGKLYMKVATEVDGELAPLSTSQMDAFVEYVKSFKYGGVVIIIISANGDDLRVVYKIWYDPLVLDENGIKLDGSGVEPAKETIQTFIKSLPFNGHFVPTSLTDALQNTEGVKIPVLNSAESRNGTNDFAIIDGYVIPRAGYLTITDEHLTINYEPYVRG